MRFATPGAARSTEGVPFATFVELHTESLFKTAYLLTGEVGASEELVQDTLTRLFARWQRVESADAPVAYVRRSLVNNFISSRRGSGRVVLVELPAHLPQLGAGPDVADLVADRQLLWHLIRRLPARQQAALVLRYFHDQSDADIAASIGCRPATVRSLISRGLAAMRELSTDVTAATTPGGRAR